MKLPSLVIAVLALFLPEGAEAGRVRKLHFDVFLNERAIGDHRFELRDGEDGTLVESEADFLVKAWVVTLFRYDHESTERWNEGCLQQIEARTDSNGKQSNVAGSDAGGSFLVRAGKREHTLAGCVRTFAYWNVDLLRAPRLLNPQTGEHVAVALTRLAGGTLEIGDGRELLVDRYALKGSDVDITLSYEAGTGEWVGLDSAIGSGRALRYRRSPDTLNR